MKINSYIFILITIFASTHARANDGYKCVPKQAFTLENDGSFSQENNLAKMIIKINKDFIVNRKTGKIIGGSGLSNHNDYFSPKVIDRGSNEQSFKALTIYQPNVSLDYLEIQEFQEGKSKPFTFFSSSFSLIVSGICEHY